MERRETIVRPGLLRRRYDPQSQRANFTPSRPNKRTREDFAEIDVELTHRASRLGEGYQPIESNEEEEGDFQADQVTMDTEEGIYRQYATC